MTWIVFLAAKDSYLSEIMEKVGVKCGQYLIKQQGPHLLGALR
jgi:hypothetical protein